MKKIKFPIDNRDNLEGSLAQVHYVLLRMLNIISSICNKHNISFWLEYGTLLGAVRHQGFIPWDTEADIGMLREDFQKLCGIILSELPNDIFFQTRNTDVLYSADQFIEAKFRDKYSNYTSFQKNNPQIKWHNGIQVDIFVYDAYLLNGEKCLINNYEKLLTNCKSFYKFEEIEKIIEWKFENTEFYIPSGYKNYLERTYGNYMELPHAADRIVEEVDPIHHCDHKEVMIWKSHL